ncbi:hypothetical protein L3Y34_005433 [Caenorhabditis briggsae]|uniref:Uncharacterized protein n=1 Tax=Caenorhabditis briggsae TaxID=6238 RepID=A0AAE9D6W8_CAEBR|nr:hypothetical protein L3Y34_005433 [Caenorhabditis briggsae]
MPVSDTTRIKIEPVDNEISIVETRTFPRVAKLARGVANLADVHKLKDFQKQAMRIATLPKSFHTWFISKDRIKEFISSFLLKQLEQETNRI